MMSVNLHVLSLTCRLKETPTSAGIPASSDRRQPQVCEISSRFLESLQDPGIHWIPQDNLKAAASASDPSSMDLYGFRCILYGFILILHGLIWICVFGGWIYIYSAWIYIDLCLFGIDL